MEKTVPAHVPAHLVVDLDIYDLPGAGEDPQLAWRSFSGRGPLVFSPYNGGHWVAATGDDVMAVFQTPDLFSSATVAIPSHDTNPLVPLESDEPRHSDYRRTVQQFLTPAAIAKIEPEIRALAVELIEELKPRGECEFVSEFALKLPLIVFLKLMGLPLDDRLYLRGLVNKLTHDPDGDERLAAYNELGDYAERWIEVRRRNPGQDAISKIIAGTVDGRPYNQAEICGTVQVLLSGGLDTVAASLGFWTRYLAAHPEERARIRAQGDDLLPIIQELMRRFSIPSMGRIVTRDAVYKGIELRKGDRVMVSPAIHNMDGSRFADPERVDFDRPQRQIGFGTGVHTCVGANLGRCEFKIFLQEWLTRIPDFALDPERPVEMRTAPTNVIENLWLTWDATA